MKAYLLTFCGVTGTTIVFTSAGNEQIDVLNYRTNSIASAPEPGSATLAALGGLGLLARRRRSA